MMPSPILLMRIVASKHVSGLFIYLAFELFNANFGTFGFLWEPDLIYRIEGGIPPLVKLLDFTNKKVQRASAGALRTLAFKNDENKNRVVESPLNFLIIYVISEWSLIVKKDIFSKEAMIVSILNVFANITPYLCREICQGKDKGNLYSKYLK